MNKNSINEFFSPMNSSHTVASYIKNIDGHDVVENGKNYIFAYFPVPTTWWYVDESSWFEQNENYEDKTR